MTGVSMSRSVGTLYYVDTSDILKKVGRKTRYSEKEREARGTGR